MTNRHLKRPATRLREAVRKIEDMAWSSHDKREKFALREAVKVIWLTFPEVFKAHKTSL